jgi:hypothetical protein
MVKSPAVSVDLQSTLTKFCLASAVFAPNQKIRYDLLKISGCGFLRGFFAQSAEEEQNRRNADARVGDIEGPPPAAA